MTLTTEARAKIVEAMAEAMYSGQQADASTLGGYLARHHAEAALDVALPLIEREVLERAADIADSYALARRIRALAGEAGG